MRFFSVLAFFLLVLLLPFFVGEFMATSLAKLQLSPAGAVYVVIGILAGSFINIPVASIARSEDVRTHPLAAYRLDRVFPQLARVGRETVISVNVACHRVASVGGAGTFDGIVLYGIVALYLA